MTMSKYIIIHLNMLYDDKYGIARQDFAYNDVISYTLIHTFKTHGACMKVYNAEYRGK